MIRLPSPQRPGERSASEPLSGVTAFAGQLAGPLSVSFLG